MVLATVGTGAEEKDLVVFQVEPRWSQGREVAGAVVDLEHPITVATVEVVVVTLVSHLVPCGGAGQFDHVKPLGGHQSLEIAVDRRQAETGEFLAAGRQNLRGAQRSASLLEDGANGAPLARLALHEAMSE